jgi:glyoxylase-like metal-dependent hydrolase (beta-lactamase superfamily II)
VYAVDVLLPTARFAFSVEGDSTVVLPEHRSPQAYALYQELKRDQPVVGMTTFPNSILLRGERTILVDPGLHLQNQPVLAALRARAVDPDVLDLIVLTHAHLDHAGACADVTGPVVVHGLERTEPDWAMVAGILELHRLTFLEGAAGEIAPGLEWALTPGHSAGSICLKVATAEGPVALVGDTIGPLREDFDAMSPAPGEGPADQIVAAWSLVRSWSPVRVVPGHLPPFAL